MMKRYLELAALWTFAAAVGLTTGETAAQSDPVQAFPAKPVHLVVPFAAGGGNDILARVLSPKMGESFGQPVLVENKPGAQGIIAAEFVMKSTPDGYTVLVGPSGPMTGNPAIYSKLPYSTLRDFLPVTMIGSIPLILVVNSSLPVYSVQELVAYAKARPTSMNYGATAALFQLTSELFNQKTGTRFQHIPYKSSAESMNAVLSGEVTITFSDPPPAAGPLKAGRLRGLAISSPSRHPAWPDIPTMAEAGISDMAFVTWYGLFLPAGTPQAIVRKLRDEVARVVALPDVRERFASLGVDPSGMAGDEFAKIVAADIARWTAVAKAANIKGD
jgi:tripartite-type tricarboxylate transporter receptor subunit TctC